MSKVGVFAALLVLAACGGGGEREAPQAPKTEAAAPAAAATCAAHGSPKELCFICDASLRETGRLWCGEHARYEDRCFLCHPELRQPDRLWCEEHSLYEDECFLCHPELKSKTAAGPAAAAPLMCREHGVPEDECGICHPELLAGKRPGEGLKVRLPAADSAAIAGIAIGAAGAGGVAEGVECLAELAFDQNRLARIAPLVGGIVESVEVDLGSRVRAGDVLARMTSAAMGEAQGAYLKALADEELRRKTRDRERSLRAERVSSERDVEEAEAAYTNAAAAVQQARQQLRVLGLAEEQIDELARERGAARQFEIRAPFAGEIVERAAVQGALVEPGAALFTLADTATLWAMIDIPEPQLARARVGQPVRVTVESLPGETFLGTLTWLAASIDERTRMARGRVELANAGGRLKARMFARALIVTAEPAGTVVVPQSAVADVAGTPVVFVREAEDLFEARPVRLGSRRDGQVVVLAGLAPAEPIVVAGVFSLKSQLLISRLGAGCVD